MEINSFNGGFAEIESDEVIVLVNNAEIGSEINVQNAEQDLKEAKLAISKFLKMKKSRENQSLERDFKAEARFKLQKLILSSSTKSYFGKL